MPCRHIRQLLQQLLLGFSRSHAVVQNTSKWVYRCHCSPVLDPRSSWDHDPTGLPSNVIISALTSPHHSADLLKLVRPACPVKGNINCI